MSNQQDVENRIQHNATDSAVINGLYKTAYNDWSGDINDYEWVKEKIFKYKLNDICEILMSPMFDKIDPKYPATHSREIIKLIRNKIGYKNILLSDDISMKALKFSIAKNTIQAFTAGCNIVMHCNGKLKEMTIVANNSPRIDNFILKKTYQFYDIIS